MDLGMATKSHNFPTIELNTVELPPCIEIKDSSVINGVPGAFSKMLIPKDTRFGPYKGEIINAGQKDYIDYRFAWEVFEKNSNILKYTINAMDSRTSNWMRHVNCARFFEEQNIISTQDSYSIYYVAMKDINPGEELLTWFDPKLLKRTQRRLSKMERKPVGYTIELVPWSDEKKFVPEIIETKRARKKKVLSDMISLDENPFVLNRTLQRLSKLPCTPKQLAQSSFRGISTTEHKNDGLDTAKSRSFGKYDICPTAKATIIPKGPCLVKRFPSAKDQISNHILGQNTKSTHQNPSGGEMYSKSTFCLALDGVTLIEKGNSLLSSKDIEKSCLKVKNKKGKANIELLSKSPIKLGKLNHHHSCDGEIVHENVTSVKPIVFTQNNDGSTAVEDHDETYILSNVELMPECDDKCLCLDNNKSVQPYCSVREKQGDFVIQFTLLPEHKSLSPDNKIIYRCDICDSAYNHAFSLKRHYLSVHVNHRYLSREDIVSCQIETFHTDIKLDSKESQIEMQTSSRQSKKSSLVKEQLSVPEINLSDFDQIDAKMGCTNKLQGKAILEDTNLEREAPTCRNECQKTFDCEHKLLDGGSEFITVQSLTNLAQMSLDKAKATRSTLNNSSKLSVPCEQIKHHFSVIDNDIQLKYDESVSSDLQCSLDVESNCIKENKAAPENANIYLLNIDNSKESCDENGAVGNLVQHSQKPELGVAKFDEIVGSQSMSVVFNSINMYEEDKPATLVESVQQSANSKTILDIIPDTSEKCCSNDSTFITVNNLVSFDSYAKGNTGPSDLLGLSPDESNHNMHAKETIETQENCIEKVQKAPSPNKIIEEITKNDSEEAIFVFQLNDSDIVHCNSIDIIKNGVRKILTKTACSVMTKTTSVDSHMIVGEIDTSKSVMEAETSTFSDMALVNKENIISPITISQGEANHQSHTLSENADGNLSEICTEVAVKLISNEITTMSNKQGNFAAVDSFSSLLPVISQSSPLAGDTGVSMLCKTLNVPTHSSKMPEKMEKSDIILSEKSTLQNTVAFPVSTLESSTTPTITSTSPLVIQNQPPQQLIFVTNIVFPVVSSAQKQIQSSKSPLSSAVSQSSSLATNQTTMASLTTSLPLVVISQVPCGLSVQNVLQSTTARKTLQSIKHSFNVLNLGNTASELHSSLLPSCNKSPITVVCENSSPENSASLGGLLSTMNVTTLTSSPRYCCPSKSENTNGKPFKSDGILNYSSPRTAVSLVYGPHLSITNTGSTKSVTVSKALTPDISSFISPKKNHATSGAQPDDLYRCHMCVLLFKTMSELKQHIRNDPHRFKGGIKQYACLQCSVRFSNKNNLMRHNLMNHPESENYKFRCFTCGKGFMSETYLKMHARFHSGKNFPCKYGCVDTFFTNAASLVKHLRTQHAGLNLKEYLRNAKAEKTRRKKLNYIFEVSNDQISNIGIEGKTLEKNETVSSLVQYSLDQPGMGFQAKRGHDKSSKNPSKEVFSKVEDNTAKIREFEFLPEVKDSYINEEKNNKLHFVCHLCLQRLSSHLKLLQHRTRKHGFSQSVQEYLYQMSKETVDEDMSETEFVKQEFSPPPSPKTFFANVNKRSYDNMKHYIDGNSESLEFWQKHLMVKDSITKCKQMLTLEPQKKLEWTMFNFPPCFEYKEDCTMFYERTTQLHATHKLSNDQTEDDKEKGTLNLCDVSGVKLETEMNTLRDTLEQESVCEEFLNECTNSLHFGNKKVFSNKNSIISDEKSLCFVSNLQHKLTNHQKREQNRNLDSEVMDKIMNAHEELSLNIMYSNDDLVEMQTAYESNSAYLRRDDSINKSGVCSLICPEEISGTTKGENYCLCRCIVNEIVSSAVMMSKDMSEVKHNLHKTQSFFNENDDVKTFQSEGMEGVLELPRYSFLNRVIVPNIHGIKVDGNKQETNTVMIVKPTPITRETFSETRMNQHRFTNLPVKEKLQTLKSLYIQGLNLAISRLNHHDSVSSFLNSGLMLKDKLFSVMHQPSGFLLGALDLHITEKQLSSNVFQERLYSTIKNTSSLENTKGKSLSLEALGIMSQNKMSHRYFDAAVTTHNSSDTSRHDHKRYSIWAGQVQQNFDKTNKEEIFCQPVIEAVRKQGVIQQQIKYKFDKSERYNKEIYDKHEVTQKICFAEGLGLMTRKEFELSYHAQKQQEFVIKVPEVWKNYENIWFGKQGTVIVVCSVCHRHFSCWDLCFRHQLKKHPHIEPASLEMEKDNYVEDMYYYYPMPYGILAQTHLIPDNLPAPEVYVCTKCGFPFKNLNRLHAHIIVCGPTQEETTSSQNDNLIKPSYIKKKLLPIMDRRLNRNLEQSKTKMSLPFKSCVYACTPSIKAKHGKSFLSQEKGNKLSLPPDNKLLSSSIQSKFSYFAPFSFYSGRKRKSYELLYNPHNHTRRREMYKILDQHQCHGCNLKFNSLSMLERHVNKCSGKDKLQSQKPLLSGIMSDDSTLGKQHTCRYCSKRFTYIKGVDLHYKRICAVRKVKEEENQLTGEDLAHEAELKKIIEHIKWSKSLNKDSSDIIQGHVIVEEDGTLTRVVKQRGSPQGLKKKMKKKGCKWTALKRPRLDEDMSSASSSAQSSPIISAEDIRILDDMKVSQKFEEVLGAREQKRLTGGISSKVVHQNCENTINRQISADRVLLRKKGKTVSQSPLTDMCSRSIVSTPTQKKKDSKRGKIKKYILNKVDTSENLQNIACAKSATNSRENVEGFLFSVTSSKTHRRAVSAAFSSSCVDTDIKPTARKRGKPKKFDPSDMESSYKKKKKCDQRYIFYQGRADITNNDLNGRKRNRSDTSFGGSSQKKRKAEMAAKGSNNVCESYLLGNKSPRNLLDDTTSSHADADKCDSSRQRKKLENKKVHSIEASKLLVKMKNFKEAAKSKRNKLRQEKKPSSSLAIGEMLNAKEGNHTYFKKKLQIDSKSTKKCCRSIKKTPSLELLKYLTKDEEILFMNNSSHKSSPKGKRTVSASSLPVGSKAGSEDMWASVKHLKISTLKTSGKSSASSSAPIAKSPMTIANNSPVMSGLRTLTKKTLGKVTGKLGGESHNHCKKSILAPAMSTCSIVTLSTSANTTASDSQSSKGILSKPSSQIFKQSISSVRIVTLSPNGTNLLTFDSDADVPQSSVLLAKSANAAHVSLPSPKIMNLAPVSIPLLTKSSVNLQPKELKTIHDPCTEKHAGSSSKSSVIIHRDNAQTVSKLTVTKATIRMNESIVQVNRNSHTSHKHISHCQNKQNTVQQNSKLINSVSSSEFPSSNMSSLQSPCLSKFNLTNSSSLTNSQETVSAIIVPSTSIKSHVTVPRVMSTIAATSLPFPTKFGSPSQIKTVSGSAIPNLIQGGAVQTGNKMIKLGSVIGPHSFISPAQLQTASITPHCQQMPSATHAVSTTVNKKLLPLSAALLPTLFANGILTQNHSVQKVVQKSAVAHSLLNIATNQTNVTTHPLTSGKTDKTYSQQISMPRSNVVNNVVTISQPPNVASIGSSIPASSIKTNKLSNKSVAVPSNSPATNQIMFSLDDGTTAMLDPDSLAQFLSISPSLTKTDLNSVTSITKGVSADSTEVINLTEIQLNQSSGDAINWPSNGIVDLTELPDSINLE